MLRLNQLRPRQNGRHFPDDIFKWIFLNENVRISINISLKFVPRGPFNNVPTLVQVMAWRRPGDKALSETMMVRLPTHICVTRPQWVKLPLGRIWHQRVRNVPKMYGFPMTLLRPQIIDKSWNGQKKFWFDITLTFNIHVKFAKCIVFFHAEICVERCIWKLLCNSKITRQLIQNTTFCSKYRHSWCQYFQ